MLDLDSALAAVKFARSESLSWARVDLDERRRRVTDCLAGLKQHRELIALLLMWEIDKPYAQAPTDIDRSISGVDVQVLAGNSSISKTPTDGGLYSLTPGPRHRAPCRAPRFARQRFRRTAQRSSCPQRVRRLPRLRRRKNQWRRYRRHSLRRKETLPARNGRREHLRCLAVLQLAASC